MALALASADLFVDRRYDVGYPRGVLLSAQGNYFSVRLQYTKSSCLLVSVFQLEGAWAIIHPAENILHIPHPSFPKIMP